MPPDARLTDRKTSFASFSHILDARILRALADMGFARPTLVQSKAIPLALENRDILARARTGSGKTAAYCIPVTQKVLNAKAGIPAEASSRQATRALILVPTRELSEQVYTHLNALLAYCEKEVTVANASTASSTQLQKSLLSDHPDIVIATPSRALALVQSKTLSLTSLDTLVIDEADLILSYGHDTDIRALLSGGHLPRVFQSFLMSATMTEDVEALKGLALRSPAILKLEEDEEEHNLAQFSVRCSEVDKFLLTYVVLKLKLVKGKCLIFVNDVERCYRVKLFLEQFGIKSCVLNSELPLNSRYHVVQEFNKGVYDYIIASDESARQSEQDSDDEEEPTGDGEDVVEEGGDAAEDDEFTTTQREQPTASTSSSKPTQKRKRSPSPSASKDDASKSSKRKQKGKHARDAEYGVARGVDFIDVACVLNFDLPRSARAYTHRVGRTARAGRTGIALSYVVPREQVGKSKVVGNVPGTERDEEVWARIERREKEKGREMKEYKFDMKQVEAFRYRMEDALRAVTRAAVREARIKELKSEILNSDKLKAHFEDNPLDLEYLRHDKPLHPTRVQPHMKHVPKYLLPRIAPVPGAEAAEGSTTGEGGEGFVPFNKNGARGRGRGRGRGGRGGRGGSAGRGRKKADPLKKFGR
ncbi:P-loop containing nucleoside triphosphate hydrolase protein [Fomitopsis serialis]|uniref:P-loop containing nucleoside triphosphate hydrolase protein n=1 Tax=Fomitopsis serialis TaxID=139415 RepID=UPI002007D7AE|nr:P-loop containing nucleoside triphosphate hydrolase protein [Neoantrodia serialis]KAH9931971.1 P-loop containing nucleoside triphosphate hydrolase protein [Neoantrodia serialis]